ncbi:MAG: hypothetical protein AAGI23_17470 [Bacteroidota bacterium]
MEFILIFLASTLLFSKSKYFPKRWERLSAVTAANKILTRLVGYFLMSYSLVLFAMKWSVFTGFVIWSVVVMLCLSVVVMVFPLLANGLEKTK